MKHSSHHLSFNKIASSVVFVFVALGISFYFLGNQNSLLTQVSGTGTITTVTTKPALLNFESSLPIAPAPAFARSCANATTFARTTLSPKAGNYSFKFSGTDDCGTANSFVYYKIADANLPITENTVLEYKIAPQNTFGQNVGVDLLLDNGQYLRDQEIYSDDTVLAHPAYQSKHSSFVSCCPLPTLATIKVNLGKLRGRTIKQIIIGYDDASNTQQGPFDARIDDIKIYDVASFRKFPLGQKVALSRDRYLSKNLHTTELVTPKQIVGATGVIIDGPIGQSPYVRWKVDFDNTTTDGWAYESDLQGPFTESQVSAVASASTNSCNNNIKGDMDCSGPIKEAVTVTDGVVVLRCAAGLSPCNTTLIDSDIIKQGDMDCDGKITVTDGVNVLRKAAGLSVPGCYQPILEIGRLETGKVLSSIIWKTLESYTVGDRIFIRLRNSAPLSNVFLQWSDSRGLYYQLEDIGYSTDLNGSVIIGPFPGGSGLPDTWPIGTSFKIKARVANIWSQESIYSVSNGARPPVPNPRPLLCMSYNVTVSDQTLRDISKWQVGVLDYYQSPAEIGAQLSRVGTGLKAFVPIYHNASDSISQIYERTRLFADQVRPYLAYVLGIYVWDEPDFNKVSFDKQQAAVDAVRQYLPGVPTYIYFSSSDGAPMPANLTYRGMPFYGKDSKDLTVVRRRLERVGAYAPRIIAVPRAWNDFGKCCDGAYGIWSDIEIAQMNAALFPELVRTPQVAGVMYYVWNIRPEDKHPSGTVGTQDLPETRKVLESVCAGY